MRVLVVEDEERFAAGLRDGLEAEGFAVDVAPDGVDGLWLARENAYDAIVLDIMLPGIDGIETCRTLRGRGVWTPVLMLTAKGEIGDRVAGLDGGADDYVVKPFLLAELVSRVRAVLRRRGRVPTAMTVGDLVVDDEAGTATRGGAVLELTATELRLLRYLVEQRGRTVTKNQILTQVWGYDAYDPNLVEVHVSALRRKLEAHGPRLVHTVRGLGYALRPVAGESA